MAQKNKFNQQVDNAPFTPVGAHTANSALSAAVPLTAPAGADRIRVQAFTANLRYTLDGTTPTATLGFRLRLDIDPVEIRIPAGATLTVIQEALNGVLQYQWGS